MLALYLNPFVFVTVVTRIVHIVGGVADLAFNFGAAPVVQGKSVLQQAGRRPGLISVTGLAVDSELTPMDVRLLMTGDAIGRQPFILAVGVAVCAVQAGMRAFKGKDFVMIKPSHGAGTVVAGQAVARKVLHVPGHKSKIQLGVTVLAKRLVEGIVGSRMAIGAGK